MAFSPLKIAAGLAGFTAVAFGAFGAHALKETLAAAGMTGTWNTASLYHLAHAVALLVAAQGSSSRALWAKAGWAWVIGILLFSGSLYTLALGGPRWLGPVTPIGGVALLVGWSLALLDGWRSHSNPTRKP